MAGQVTTSLLAQKLGAKFSEGWNAHKGDETEVGNFSDLPAGVSGIAELREIKITLIAEGKTNAGKPMFYAHGTVLEPTTFKDKEGNVHNVRGRLTKISENLFDTPESLSKRKTVSDHVAWMQNAIRLLGVETNDKRPEDLEAIIIPWLKKTRPQFYFSTKTIGERQDLVEEGGKWYLVEGMKNGEGGVKVIGKDGKVKSWPSEQMARAANKYAGKDQMVLHFWEGKVEHVVEVDGFAQDGVEDNTPPAHPELGNQQGNGTEAAKTLAKLGPNIAGAKQPINRVKSAYSAVGATTKTTVTNMPAPAPLASNLKEEVPEPQQFNEFTELEVLVTAAEAGIPDGVEADDPVAVAYYAATDRLREVALEVGISQEIIDDADMTWAQLGALIEEAQGQLSEGQAGDPQDARPTFKAGDTVTFLPPGKDPRTKAPFKRPITVEVQKVDLAKREATVKSMVDGKSLWQGVSFDALVG